MPENRMQVSASTHTPVTFCAESTEHLELQFTSETGPTPETQQMDHSQGPFLGQKYLALYARKKGHWVAK